MTSEFILQIIVSLCAGAGAYAAIRADLARLHERATIAHDAAKSAHKRIDNLMSNHQHQQ